MSRGLTTAAANAAAEEVVRRTVAVALDFSSGWVRLNGSPVDLTIDGDTYVGIGGLGAISRSSESAELRSYDLTVALTGIPVDVIALALAEDYQGRAGMVWEVLLDRSTNAVIADPVLIFRGRMDTMDITVGQTATVTVTMQNRLADWERPRILRYTDEDQKRLNAGDRGMEFLAATVEKQLIWPAGSWWDKQR